MPVRLCLTLALVLFWCAGGAGAQARLPQPSKVVLIVLENREFDQVIGSPEAPYLNHLAQRGALATDYFGVTHPSLPNYLALLGGSTFGVVDNCADCLIAGPNLATQLSRGGVSWRAYMGGMPYPCYGGTSYGGYAKRHDPFMYFTSITAVPSRCARVVPETRLRFDLLIHGLPSFVWITPDVCQDGHDCPLSVADLYLYELVPRLTRQLGPHGLLIVTFDEGASDAGCCGSEEGGRVATVLVGPGVPHGIELPQPAGPYSLLAALEERFGLPRLGLAATAASLSPALFAAAE